MERVHGRHPWEVIEFLFSARSIAENPILIVPVVELCCFAEDEGDPEGDNNRASKEESSVTGSHGGRN